MPKVLPQYRKEATLKILNAAAEAFAEKGYGKATMDDVAKKIGVSKGALYLYFKSKEQLFEEISRTELKDLEDNLYSAFTATDVKKGAEAYFDSVMKLSAPQRTLWLQTLAEARSNRAVKEILEEGDASALKVLERFADDLKKRGTIDPKLDSVLVARVFMAFHDGVVVSLLEGINESTAKEMWMQGIGFLVSGMSS